MGRILLAVAALCGTALATTRYVSELRGWGTAPLAALPSPFPAKASFRLHAPGASSVEIAADFTGWRERPLKAVGAGLWEANLDAPPGRRTYLFKIDGRWSPDPANPATIQRGPLTVSVKEVH